MINPVIDTMDDTPISGEQHSLDAELTEFARQLQSIARKQSKLTGELTLVVRAAVNDVVNAKRTDRATLCAVHLSQLRAIWPAIRRAIIFACGGYAKDANGVYWRDDDKSLLVYDSKNNLFATKPQTNAYYATVKQEWDINLSRLDYVELKGKEKAAAFSARAEIAKLINKLEKNQALVIDTERNLLRQALELLKRIDEDN